MSFKVVICYVSPGKRVCLAVFREKSSKNCYGEKQSRQCLCQYPAISVES